MKPIDYRNETWDSIQKRVNELRLSALWAWRCHGPGTTEEVATRANFSLLTFRPRTTELYQMGALQEIDDPAAIGYHKTTRGCVYRARGDAEWRQHLEGEFEQAREGQMKLTLSV
jgi:hypothetical protein